MIAAPRRRRHAPAVRRELNSNIAAIYKVDYGDTQAAFAKAAHVFHEELWQHRGGAHPDRRPRHCRRTGAMPTAMTVWASTQKAHDLFQSLTSLLGFEESALRVATPDVGGGFGPEALRLSRGYCGGGGREARCGARSNGSRTGASISPMRRRSAISIGRSTSRSTRDAKRSRHPRPAHSRSRRLCAAGRQHSRTIPPRC